MLPAGLRRGEAHVTDPVDAERLAGSMLAPLGDRWRHVQAVTAAARAVSGAVDPDERNVLIAAAWLHDIGYAPDIARLRFHPVDGARHLESLNAPRRLCALVAHHSCARFEAEERGLTADLAPWELETSAVMDALCMADMTTGPQGQQMAFEERVAEIRLRYGDGSIVPRSINRARSTLQGSIDRTVERLAVRQR